MLHIFLRIFTWINKICSKMEQTFRKPSNFVKTRGKMAKILNFPANALISKAGKMSILQSEGARRPNKLQSCLIYLWTLGVFHNILSELTGQISMSIRPMSTRRVSRLCVSSCGPWGESSWCKPCRSLENHTYAPFAGQPPRPLEQLPRPQLLRPPPRCLCRQLRWTLSASLEAAAQCQVWSLTHFFRCWPFVKKIIELSASGPSISPWVFFFRNYRETRTPKGGGRAVRRSQETVN